MAVSIGLRVSAIIPAFNAAHFVADAIESALAQTRRPDEIVVVDDGSTDDTAQVVAHYASQGVRYIYQPNRGPGSARNRGIWETSGELIAFLDADDLWLPNKTEVQAAYLATHPAVALVSCDRWMWKIEKGRRSIERFGPPRGVSARREVMVRNIVGNPSQVMVRREAAVSAGGFDTTMRWAEEWDLWTRIAARADIGFIHQPLCVYRWHSGGLAHENMWRRLAGQQAIAFRAISAFQPFWLRPLLLLRAWSMVEMVRATYAVDFNMPRTVQIRHALQVLLCPFGETREKMRVAIRALLGREGYAAVIDATPLQKLRLRGAQYVPEEWKGMV
jgi:glycosyltransferase involved in cell wall biosynthesis